MPTPQLSFDRPWPALTPAQRYHLEVFGYVVVPGTLSAPEISQLKSDLYALREDLRKVPKGTRVRAANFLTDTPDHVFMGSILEATPAISAYCTHPRLVAMAEELIGGEARIVEVNGHINRRLTDKPLDPAPTFGFHRGTDVPFAIHQTNDLSHCSFVKTLTNLTDLGPDDGGTVVIAGSHKVAAPVGDLIKLAYEDRSLIHRVVAPAGSTLLFSETLIHATGQVRSDNERVIIICGYGSTLFPWWDGGTLTDGFVQQIPDNLKILFHGKANWTRGPRYRTLAEPADPRPFGLGTWNQR